LWVDTEYKAGWYDEAKKKPQKLLGPSTTLDLELALAVRC